MGRSEDTSNTARIQAGYRTANRRPTAQGKANPGRGGPGRDATLTRRAECTVDPPTIAMSTIASVETIVLEVPLTPHQEKILPLTHRQYGIQHLIKVTLSGGTVGWGEGSAYSGLATPEKRAAALGQPAASLMYDDSIGTNLQMALFDAVGHELGVPVHQLLPGKKHRDWVPLSWCRCPRA